MSLERTDIVPLIELLGKDKLRGTHFIIEPKDAACMYTENASHLQGAVGRIGEIVDIEIGVTKSEPIAIYFRVKGYLKRRLSYKSLHKGALPYTSYRTYYRTYHGVIGVGHSRVIFQPDGGWWSFGILPYRQENKRNPVDLSKFKIELALTTKSKMPRRAEVNGA